MILKKLLRKWATLFSILALFTNILALLMVFFYAPTEVQMGEVQKIFYYHVPCAIASYFMVFISFVFSIAFLVKKDEKYDIWAYAGAEVGLVFILCVLVSGPIWGKAAWGKWWVWEPRLTTFLIIFLIYFSYILVRIFGKQDTKTLKVASVFSIIGFLDVPLVNRAVYWWGSIVHPQSVSLEPQMKLTFFVSLISVIILSLSFLFWRVSVDERVIDND